MLQRTLCEMLRYLALVGGQLASLGKVLAGHSEVVAIAHHLIFSELGR